jgi:transcriptional regulator with XRE-family HTH domain
MTESQIARAAGVGRSTVNRWARGANRPDHDPIRRLAAATFRRYPGIARKLVEASGYDWAEPSELPPPDVLADELGQDAAGRVRRELARRGKAGAVVLAEMERVLSSPVEEEQSGPARAVS